MPKLFAVSWVSLFDNIVHIEFLREETETQALGRAIPGCGIDPTLPLNDYLKALFDQDTLAGVRWVELEDTLP